MKIGFRGQKHVIRGWDFFLGHPYICVKRGKVVVDVSEVQREQDFLCWATMLRPSEALGPQKVVVVAKSQ